MKKIRKGDEIYVTTGRDKGKRGAVLRVLDDEHVIVEGVHVVKRHTKPNPQAGLPGGIIEKEAPIHISNVALFNPVTVVRSTREVASYPLRQKASIAAVRTCSSSNSRGLPTGLVACFTAIFRR